MKLVLDVESTGRSSTSDILQLSVIKLDDNDLIITANNFYFKTDRSYPEAYMIHGLLKEQLANSKYSQKDIPGILNIFMNNVDLIIGWNIPFDVNMLASSFMKNGVNSFNLINTPQLDLMVKLGWFKETYRTKGGRTLDNLRLEEALSIMINKGVDLNKLEKNFKNLFKVDGVSFHNSMWDVYITFYLYKHFYLKGISQY